MNGVPVLVVAMVLAARSAIAQPFTPLVMPDINAHVGYDSGVAWVDYDGDGDLDLYVIATSPATRPNLLYRNDGGTFTRVTGVPIVLDNAETNSQAWADVDNDGDLDLYLSNFNGHGGQFYRAQGSGSLTLETDDGLSSDALPGRGCAWGDYDEDGFVDLIVAARFGFGGILTPNLLFKNLGGVQFARVDTGAVVTGTGTYWTPSWADWDGDGDLDLSIACDPGGHNGLDRFYLNRLRESGVAWFEPMTGGPLASGLRQTQLVNWADYDNDGDLDAYLTNAGNLPNELYRNEGASFTRVTAGPEVTDIGISRGSTWGDFDNDGDLDLFVVRDASQSNRFYRNDGGGTFASLTTGALVTDARSDWGSSAGDFDRDGDLDLFVTALNDGPSRLYRNDLVPGAHWLEVRPVGVQANRSGIGVKARLFAHIGGQPVAQMRELSTQNGFGGHDALLLHFGLGDAARVDSLRLEWPGGHVDRWLGIPMDTLLTIEEGAGVVSVPVTSALHRQLFSDVSVRPTPATGQARIHFVLARSTRVELALFDLSGRSVGRTVVGTFGAGVHELPLSELAGVLRAGRYLLRTRGGDEVHTVAVVVVR